MSKEQNDTRRDFLKKSSLLTAGSALSGGLSFARSAHAAGSDEMKACLIGCGGRGVGAAHNCLDSVQGVKIVAVADAFDDRAKDAANDLRASAGIVASVVTADRGRKNGNAQNKAKCRLHGGQHSVRLRAFQVEKF